MFSFLQARILSRPRSELNTESLRFGLKAYSQSQKQLYMQNLITLLQSPNAQVFCGFEWAWSMNMLVLRLSLSLQETMTTLRADICSDNGTKIWGSLENIKKLLDIVEIMASTADKLTFLHVFEAVMGIIGTKGAES
jgi:hypothetical protein